MDFIGYFRRLMNRDVNETFDPATDSLEAIRDFLATGGSSGLAFLGVVTAVPGANQFTIATLTGHGDTAFVGWSAFVFWDAAGGGAAPQGEQQAITVYTSATGVFTTGAFTVAAAVGDIVLILHPRIAELADLITSRDRQLFSMDFWSDPQEELSIPAIAGTQVLPSVTVADLPAGATIVRAIAMVKFRAIENTNVAANKLDGATVAATSQVVQVDDSAATGFVDAINFVDDQFGLALSTRENGDILIGSIDISARVDGNDIYDFRYLLAKADLDAINWNDLQTGLRIVYSV